MSPKKHRPLRLVVRLIVIVAFLLGALFIVTHRQAIIDQVWVWQYHPSTEITNLVERAGMNDKGKFLYYASQPTLDGTQNFNKECDRVETSTAILGCYDNYKIYIYNVSDPQLDGIREVTAAHETLHAAYQRLSDTDRNAVDKLLEAEYTKLENDPDYKARMAYYAKAEPGQRDNELHSVIGTEVANISPALEKYYAQYFSNRQDVVSLSTKYKSVFDNITNQATNLANQLTTLSSLIKTESASYNSDVATLNTDIASFNSRANNNGFSSASEFTTARNALSARVTALDGERTKINNDVTNYNTILGQYNALATQSKQLYNSIDSSLAPAPSV